MPNANDWFSMLTLSSIMRNNGRITIELKNKTAKPIRETNIRLVMQWVAGRWHGFIITDVETDGSNNECKTVQFKYSRFVLSKILHPPWHGGWNRYLFS